MSADRRPIPPALGLLTGVTAASTASIFIRLAQEQVDSLAVAAWRLTLASLILLPLALLTRRDELHSMSRREWALALGSGLLLAIHFASWITSLALTSVAASVVLVATAPLWVGLASYLLLGERPGRWMTAGLAVALVGSAVIALGDLGQGSHRLAGDLLALVGALAGGGYFLIGRRLRARLSLLGYVFPVYGTAAVLLLVAAALTRTPLGGYAPVNWLWLLLLALVPQIVGHSSLNWALRHLSATYVALAALGEPIGSTLLAWALLDEPPTWQALLGGTLILTGIAIASRPDKTRLQNNAE